ncbi:MAG: hypothetical protein U9N79_08290 [Actinomycetota bacterium]|nr:hypothetical protein [Actinomycetota bacterium]
MSEDPQEQIERREKTPVVIAITLAVIAAILVSIAVDTYWLHDRIFDSEHFVESLAPLPKDPAISTAIAVHAAEALDQGTAIEQRVAEALPEKLGFLTPKFVEFTQEFVLETTKQLVESDAFAKVWTAGLRTMHATFVGVLQGDVATTESGDIGIDLDGAAGLVVDRLEERGVDLFADVETSLGEIVLIQADLLAAPRTIIGVFHTAVWVFPLAALILIGIAVFIDRDRFRPIQWFGFGSAVTILLSLALLRGAVNAAGTTIESDVDRAAADAIWNALLDGYVRLSVIVGLAMLAVGLGAWWWRRQSVVRSP